MSHVEFKFDERGIDCQRRNPKGEEEDDANRTVFFLFPCFLFLKKWLKGPWSYAIPFYRTFGGINATVVYNGIMGRGTE